MKKIKYFTVLMLAVITLISTSLSVLLYTRAATSDNLGTVTECRVDRDGQTVSIRGSIKHSVLVGNRESKLAVYRFDSWVNISSVIQTCEPLETMDMTIRFDFSLPCVTIAQRLSLYAVAIISPDGEVRLISEPRYADHYTSDTSSTGFKAVNTEDISAAAASHPGSAIVDVYLDKLDKGNKSGYIFNADGELFYFDREVIRDLDKKILSYTASGANVYFRFLISGDSAELPFCTKGNLWATNKCVVVNSLQALNSIYAYTNFLISRYDGAEYGKVDGIILGKGCDMPVLYNYAALISEDYESVYARSLALIGISAIEAAGDGNLSLIVPVGDSLTENGKVYASAFLQSVAQYIENHTDFGFTVMCESKHNPYKLNDSYFSTEIEPDDNTDEEDYWNFEDTNAANDQSEPADTSSETESIFEELTLETEEISEEIYNGEEDILPETTIPSESEKIVPNTDSDGYFCTDNINIFLNMFNSLNKKYSSVNNGFAWCWYPDANTIGGSLGVCYAYNYMKLATVGADFYAIGFENEASEKFSSISHLFKYIDTKDNENETEYARSFFGINDWSDIIGGYYSGTGVFHNLHEVELEPNVLDFVGSMVYFDYSVGRGTGGWFGGLYCDSLGSSIENSESFLKAVMDLDSAGVNQSEIGYIFDDPEPLLMGDALTFEVKCGEDDGSLYEIIIHICSNKSTIVSKAVVAGGVKCALSVDVSDHDNTDAVDSVKIMLKRVTGSGKCNLNLYRVLINSRSATDEQLSKEFDSIREYLRADPISAENKKNIELVAGVAFLVITGAVAIVAALINDKKNRSDLSNEEITNKAKVNHYERN